MNYQCNECNVEFEDLDTISNSFGESVCPDCGSNNIEPQDQSDFYIEQTGFDEEDMLINGIEDDDSEDPEELFFEEN